MGDIKLDGETRNLESDNVRTLQEAFPEVVADGKVDFDKLKLTLGEDVDDSDERYSFTWPGKRDAIKMAISRTTGTLRPDKKNSKEWDTTENLFIEGDNLEVLRVLQNSYRGKVKCIYIDPPYNTGKDFVYKDDFKDNLRNYKEQANLGGQSNPETAGRYHTNWLNMMYPRLRLAKNLLKDDGVIFISIDDHEVHNLRKICDEIFGEGSFIEQFIWRKKYTLSFRDETSVNVHEYILVYKKKETPDLIEPYYIARETVPVSPVFKSQNTITTKLLRAGARLKTNKKLTLSPGKYELPSQTIEIHNDAIFIEGILVNDVSITARFGIGQDTLDSEKNNILVSESGAAYIISDGKETKVRPISILLDYTIDDKEELYENYKERKFVSTRVASAELENLLGIKVFDNPKPVALIQHLLKIVNDDQAIIIDFFSGSASTAHAVIAQNAEDSGNRRFIMVQIPESTPENSEARKAGYKTIPEISRKRIELAGEKIKADHKDKLAERTSPLDVGFKAFTLDTTNFREWDSNTDNIQNELLAALETFKDGRNSEDALYEVLLKYGVDITEPVEVISLGGKQVYSLAGNYLLVCLEKDIPLGTIEAMTALKPERVVCYDDGFADEDVKQNALETLKRAGVADVRVV